MKITATRLSLLGWLLALSGFYLVVIYFVSHYRSDFAMFYASLRFLLEGKDIYAPVPLDAFGLINTQHTGRQTLHPNLNPPFFTLLLSPLGLLSYQTAFWVWSLMSLCFGVIGAVLMQHTKDKPGLDYTLAILVLLFAYFPTLTNILLGQTALLVFMLIAAGWVTAHQGQERLSGTLLGLAFAIKLFLGLFIIYFLLQRRWRASLWFLLTVTASWLIGWAALGLDTYEHYHQALASVTWQASNWNASAYGFFTRLFGGSENTPLIDAPLMGKALYYLQSAILLALLVWLLRTRQHIAPKVRLDLGFSFTLVAALLISPLGWVYYFPLLSIPFFVLFRLAYSYGLPRKFKFALLLTLLASSFPQLLTPAAETNQIALTLAAYYFYALIGLGCLIIVANVQLQGRQPSDIASTNTEQTKLLHTFLTLLLFYLAMATILVVST